MQGVDIANKLNYIHDFCQNKSAYRMSQETLMHSEKPDKL